MTRYTWRTGIREVVMIAVGLVFLFPIYILVNVALSTPSEPNSVLLPPSHPTWSNFGRAWVQGGLGPALLWTALLVVVTVLAIVVVSSMAAYLLARATARWSSAVYYLFMVGLLLPVQIGLVPLYRTMTALQLTGSLVPLFLIFVGVRLPFSIFLYTQFIRQVPIEYEEAALIDGAGSFAIFRRIVFPLVRPVTGVVVIINGLFVFGDFMLPLLYTTGTDVQTLTVAIYSFVGEFRSDWNLIFAALIIAAIPMLVVYFFLQRTLIQGFASGIKG
jgi:raffinose/stachyose/melibiose transport system permease protein